MNVCKTCQVLECVHQVFLWCACEMHEQCMNKHTWGKVCKTHNQWSKHVKYA